MRIEKGSRVTLAYSMALEDGTEIESVSAHTPFQFVMGTSEVFPAIEGALWHRRSGESFAFDVRPEDGFGPYDDQLVRPYPREVFDEDPAGDSPGTKLVAGQSFTAEMEGGVPVTFLVKEIRGEEVMVDFNHPFAGRALKVRVTILNVE